MSAGIHEPGLFFIYFALFWSDSDYYVGELYWTQKPSIWRFHWGGCFPHWPRATYWGNTHLFFICSLPGYDWLHLVKFLVPSHCLRGPGPHRVLAIYKRCSHIRHPTWLGQGPALFRGYNDLLCTYRLPSSGDMLFKQLLTPFCIFFGTKVYHIGSLKLWDCHRLARHNTIQGLIPQTFGLPFTKISLNWD